MWQSSEATNQPQGHAPLPTIHWFVFFFHLPHRWSTEGWTAELNSLDKNLLQNNKCIKFPVLQKKKSLDGEAVEKKFFLYFSLTIIFNYFLHAKL